MRLPGEGLTVHRTWAAMAGAWAVATLALVVAMDRLVFADAPPAFRLTAAVVWVVPSALLAGAIFALAWAIKAARRHGGVRVGIRGMMVAVALVGSWLGAARWWIDRNFATVYSPGYDEGRFRLVRIGMTRDEVVSILGRPLREDSERGGGGEVWIYSEPPPPGTVGDNYWRRWVWFDAGKVVAIVDDYYVD